MQRSEMKRVWGALVLNVESDSNSNSNLNKIYQKQNFFIDVISLLTNLDIYNVKHTLLFNKSICI